MWVACTYICVKVLRKFNVYVWSKPLHHNGRFPLRNKILSCSYEPFSLLTIFLFFTLLLSSFSKWMYCMRHQMGSWAWPLRLTWWSSWRQYCVMPKNLLPFQLVYSPQNTETPGLRWERGLSEVREEIHMFLLYYVYTLSNYVYLYWRGYM